MDCKTEITANQVDWEMTPTKQPALKNPMRPSSVLPRVAFVTAGQSPRDEMMHEVLELTDRKIEVDEFGALDGLDENDLEMLHPGRDDQRIFTRLANGSSVVVASDPLETRIANICAGLDSQDYDLIVVLSTGLYSDFRTFTPLLHAQRVMDTWFASISMTECNLGVIHPLKAQGEVTRRRLGGMMKIQTNCVLGDRSDRLEQVANRLRVC